ncbi:hypothetical protein WMY93_026200 [Mugilogobius chulae]|uniref:Uncharacterized protein n=1 Tax=Mugilogobius chulae TaxID=88201 RepID=A0AAW0N090_9GOBI
MAVGCLWSDANALLPDALSCFNRTQARGSSEDQCVSRPDRGLWQVHTHPLSSSRGQLLGTTVSADPVCSRLSRVYLWVCPVSVGLGSARQLLPRAEWKIPSTNSALSGAQDRSFTCRGWALMEALEQQCSDRYEPTRDHSV